MTGTKRTTAGGTNPPEQFAVLRSFDRLEVGPVKIEKKRLVCPYTVVSGRRRESIDLVYRYEEEVFEPESAESANLASMAAAQVALNYGLFCDEIVLRGVFDDADRSLLSYAAENTAREIYVKKFLEPNPFLTEAAAGLEPVKLDRYCRATLRFEAEEGTERGGGAWQLRPTDPNRCVVLSSGGKDSLLSWGLLDEIGCEVHPVFVNESGRHWFTALNAYRHFRDNVPHTARVWTNADRVFAWMLRRLPFIRPDFLRLRTDEYAVRLWTVAVFLFGVLPVAMRRGAGRIVIGDEYDTTRRTSYKGITHYDGLYDQSRFFDNALSRYYLRKGWGMSQFSILRPVSEFLIEKTLVERYPDLQEHQVSCHASHMEKGRVRPCGRCEKCRRIVGMLTALGVDPARCGYDPGRIRASLDDFIRLGINQESAGERHIIHLLRQRGVVEPAPGRDEGFPEVMQLRFDETHASLDEIPTDIRRPLLDILLRHAEGALRREGRAWRPYDPLADPAIGNPYAFEPAVRNASKGARAADTWRWGELSWPLFEKRTGAVDIALLPVGSIEQHGPHLPLDTDAFDAGYLADRIAEACSDPKPFVLPLIPYGVSYEHDEFPGTLSIENETMSRMVYEIGMGAARNGIRKLVIVNGHGGNNPALNYAAQMITRDAEIFVCVDTGETSDVDIDLITETPNDIHAGETETSTSLAVRPELVDMSKAPRSVPRFSSRYLNFTSKRGVSWYVYTKRISKSGVIGDPTKASAEKGERIWRVTIAHLVALVEDLKGMTLEEIYQKRY
ncbi:MAG: creatininase family protein [Candidatus Krumholzibacteriota bacterium]|nr:creatininase family protein [Candidatus Krumholzibacteriota bacterium]